MDYKGMISRLRYNRVCSDDIAKAATAIETLLAERDAAVKDLTMIAHCKTCGNMTQWCADNPDSCKGYVWRGPNK